MAALDASLRNKLESLVVKAREVSETASEAAMKRLAVHEREAYSSMSREDRHLRRLLRAKGRQLGDPLDRGRAEPIPSLVNECAYEQWHARLFAAFLAENNLLIHPDAGVPVTLHDCEELARDEGDADGWAAAARYASSMLPGIFKVSDPLLQVRFAPEDRRSLERLIQDIPKPVFTSDDGLGWVYQFWQTRRKEQVNKSGRKIGGTDISAVTQLFTEHYMVQFLLHNTLGAWWTARHPDRALPTSKSYLRTVDDGTPAAGTFDGWPDAAKETTIMDPCCGSGHFLVAAFALMKRFRMIEEGLSEAEAGDAVIRDNLFGLELDPRCTQLAAFNLALEAWKSGGYRQLPHMNIACSGIPVGGQESDWTRLSDDPRAQQALSRLFHLFRNAPDLGSLIDPSRLQEDDQLFTASFEDVEELLDRALAESEEADPVRAIFGEAAKGIVNAATLLKGKYHLVATNVPYLARGKQDDILKDYLERFYPLGKADIATAFVERCRDFSMKGGTYALVTPQNWLFLGSYKGLRKKLLESQAWNVVARLGPKAFRTPMWDFNIMLCALTNARPKPEHRMAGMDASVRKRPEDKECALLEGDIRVVEQAAQVSSPNAAIVLETKVDSLPLLERYAASVEGLSTGDGHRFIRAFWEIDEFYPDWEFLQGTNPDGSQYGGRSNIVLWQRGVGALSLSDQARIQGHSAWTKTGVFVSQMRNLNCGIYLGDKHDKNAAAIIPYQQRNLCAILSFLRSPSYNTEVRKVNQKLNVATATLVRVPFDLEYWQKVAEEKYPDGLPEPYSNDPTQWLFNGSIVQSTEPLQVAVARLLGYRWPEQRKSTEKHPFPESEQDLDDLIDADGIVCLPAVAGQRPAAERLRSLLARAYGSRWTPTMEAALLASVGYDGKSLEDWLWSGFFKQHCRLFKNRPFIWHVSDGVKDGFSALVNYHGLDRAKLERLIYTYLGSHIHQQEDGARTGVRGADLRLAKAQDLKKKLELILRGEKPYDIYVRWKPFHEQPMGWDPDLNDGVRLNIRPFVKANVLRSRVNVNWNKDRGTDPKPNASGTTERHNDLHFTLEEKRRARAAQAAD